MAAKSILIVDDEVDLRDILSMHFDAHGFRVATAGGGDEALALVAASPFDIVLSDISMPKGDGMQLLKAIRERGAPRPLVMLMTGFAEVTVETAKQAGAVALVIKPFSLAAVSEQVERCLG
jgi:DNA-binding NtrC family response regulator